MSNFPRWCLFFDFHTMPANPDVGKGFDIEAITDRFVEAGVQYVVFPRAATSARPIMTRRLASSIPR